MSRKIRRLSPRHPLLSQLRSVALHASLRGVSTAAPQRYASHLLDFENHTDNAQTWDPSFDNATFSEVPDTSDVLMAGMLTLKYRKPDVETVIVEEREEVQEIEEEEEGSEKEGKSAPFYFPKDRAPPWPGYAFDFGITPFPNRPRPEPAFVKQLINILDEDLKKNYGNKNRRGDNDLTLGPFHAARNATIDTVVRVILSQATSNENAMMAQHEMCKFYPYTVNGERVIAKVPNYHDMRLESVDKLTLAIKPAGFQTDRARRIIKLLDKVVNMNIAHLTKNGEEIDEFGNKKDSPTFVPGLLSLEILGDKDKRALFGWFLDVEGIAIKTASCILAFAYDIPVCAVDTHVLRQLKWLGWVPPDCTEEKAAMHVDCILEDCDKNVLHQLFWNHANKCPACKSRGPSAEDIEKGYRPCPMEEFMDRKRVEIKPRVTTVRRTTSTVKTVRVKNLARFVAVEKLSAEDALRLGYRLEDVATDDGFGLDSLNISVTPKWVLATEYTPMVPRVQPADVMAAA